MLDLIKKGMLAGLGAAVLTRDKVLEATRKLVDEGKLSNDEAETLTDELIKSGEREWEEAGAKIHSSFRKVSESLEVVRKKDFLDLLAKVETLEQRLAELEKERAQTATPETE
jgi:polyhydroxyalkanoate synthesis regulator phasin